mmetsp:Transcript_13419/g.29630  ORF Transcript_13419/g.29630 Transcript_13419/m.29630 type:complete len:81 (-) Transcript_13419:6-248(-)
MHAGEDMVRSTLVIDGKVGSNTGFGNSRFWKGCEVICHYHLALLIDGTLVLEAKVVDLSFGNVAKKINTDNNGVTYNFIR